jgi:GxxExxY protein
VNRQNAKDAKVGLEPDDELDRLAHAVIGAAIEVHRTLGPGFLESVYERALCLELRARGIRFDCQVPVAVFYKGKPVGEGKLDLLVDRKLVVELKTVESILPIHVAQALSYLRATRKKLALLFNFKDMPLGTRRIVRS